jgi:Ulp1 protease family, C-terminal catalytic domain
VQVDDDLVAHTSVLSLQFNPSDCRVVRVLHRPDGLATKHFDPPDLHRFHSEKMLNDVCINGGAALLQDYFALIDDTAAYSRRCAILSTHELPRVRYQALDNDLWRNIRRTIYWEKDVWILPIHRPRALHWVLGVIYVRENRILLFDSFAEEKPWRADIKDILTLISRMTTLATRNGHPLHLNINNFTAHPIAVCIFKFFSCSPDILPLY